MDKNLLYEIENAILREIIDCRLIPEDEGLRLIRQLAEKFAFDLDKRWLWDDARAKEALSYGESGQWEDLLKLQLASFKDRVFLCVTNDDLYPWPIFDCRKDQLVRLFAELPYFEYLLFDAAMERVLFDTHHNELVIFHG